ncbi:Hypothetical_protein [Hexamita inflata]|uniref:Hypothetical_protein n=1 Tax=Hexamita inflata TaxID=28002 RepID=A0AA86Q7K7_9EUKA|nr:Hypothetical protein HINF_LOCUS39821 [Hexamita inflata]
MNPCRILEQKLFGSRSNLGFYSIENNCIVAYHYQKNQKVEYFFNLDALEQKTTSYNKCMLTDPKSGVKLIVNQFKNEFDSLNLMSREEVTLDEYFDFEPNGSSMYSDTEMDLPSPSFKVGGTLQFLEE